MLGRGQGLHGTAGEDVGVPPAPRTPSAAARQIVFAYAGAQRAMIVLGAVFTLLGAGLTIAFGFMVPAELLLDLTGVPAEGVVTASKLDRNTRINGHHPTDVAFRYDVAGRSYEASSSTTDRRLEGVSRGARVAIVYAPARPGLAKLQGGFLGLMGYAGLFPLLFALVGLPMALLARRSNQREIRAFTRGEPVLGRLLSFDLNRAVRINKRHPWELRWEFHVNGQRYTGSLSSMDRAVLEPYAVEAPVVLYDPAAPAVNTLWIP